MDLGKHRQFILLGTVGFWFVIFWQWGLPGIVVTVFACLFLIMALAGKGH